MALIPATLHNKTSLQMKTVKKEQRLAEKSIAFQNMDVTEGVSEEMTKMDHILDRPDDKHNFSENPQTNFIYKVDTQKQLESEHGQDPDKQDEREVHLAPRVSSSSQFSQKSVPELSQESTFLKLNQWNAKMRLQVKELGADHIEWMEKISNIIQKINNTKSTVKSLLNEVISLEDQAENLEDHDQEANIEVKIKEIRKQLKEMNSRLAQVYSCNEAHELKEKLIEQIENRKEMNLLNTRLEEHHMQERDTDSHSSEDVDVEGTELLFTEASPPASGCTFLLRCCVHVLKLFLMFYVVTFTGLSCYILFVDASFVFERVLPSVLGRRTMWELREMIAPFLNLEVEDLLPS